MAGSESSGVYLGHPEWRLDNYKGQEEILRRVFAQLLRPSQHYDAFTASNTGAERITKLVQMLEQGNAQLSGMENLALVTKIRQELSHEPQISNEDLLLLVTNTSLVQMALQILDAPDSPDLRFLKLEAAWILTNIAYGSEEVLKALMTPHFVAVV